MPPLASSSTIGILGAGQLGKMLAEAARKLGFKTHVYAPDSDPIAARVSDHFTQAEYTDIDALQKFAAAVNVITFEFENVPVEPLKALTTAIYPNVSVLEVSQHRIREKTLAQSLGIQTAPFMAVHSREDLERAIVEIGTPGILKTCTMGYDGKGQWKIRGLEDSNLRELDTIFSSPLILESSNSLIYEGYVNFEREISVIVARSSSGDVRCFEPVENVHQHHILHTTTVPANIAADVGARAIEVATKLAESLHVIGLLAVEMFVTKQGEILLNEIAPRPHNSGHWTLDGCNVSQFEQAIRAVTGMPLIKPERTAQKVVMTNLIGADVNELSRFQKASAHVHIYGKKEVREGRKMGHVTEVQP